MDWSCFRMFKKQEEKSSGVLKGVLITVGIITAIAAAAIVVYKIFKKYFTITFECDDCENCDGDCMDDLFEDVEEPAVCCCEEEGCCEEASVEA